MTHVNAAAAQERLGRLLQAWSQDKEARGEAGVWGASDVLVCALGGEEVDGDDAKKSHERSSGLMGFLFGLRLTGTLILLDPKNGGKLTVLTRERFVPLLSSLTEEGAPGGVAVEVLTRSKQGDASNIDRLVSRIKGDRAKTIAAGYWFDAPAGESTDLAVLLMRALAEEGDAVTLHDGSDAVAAVTSVKEDREIKNIKSSASITDVVFKKHFVPKLEDVIEEGRTDMSAATLGATIDALYKQPKQISAKLTSETVDSAYVPYVHVGASPFPPNMADSVNAQQPIDIKRPIVCSLASKYKGYPSTMARTILINPSSEVDSNYKHLVEAHDACVAAMVPGATAASVYEAARSSLAAHGLDAQLSPEVGHSIGQEFYESFLLGPGNTLAIQSQMAFNLQLSLNCDGYVLALGNTVLVGSTKANVLTTKTSNSAIRYDFDAEEEESSSAGDGAVIMDRAKRPSRLRDIENAKAGDAARRAKQKELGERLQEEALQRFAGTKPSFSATGERIKDWTQNRAYPDASRFPPRAVPGQIFVDESAEAVVLPIYGQLVPFSVSLLKAVTKTADRLRLQFITPSKAKNAAPAVTLAKSKPETVFVKEFVFLVPDFRQLSELERSIRDLKKRVLARDKRKTEVAQLVKMDPLILSREKNVRLPGLFVKPSLGGKRVTGTLSTHYNGFRYETNKGQKLDILYSNVRHAFFQPADREAVVILHFHLHNAIMVGKKKSLDVQLYMEVMEASTRLDAGHRRMYGDKDEVLEEQREKENRIKKNQVFHKFTKQAEAFALKAAKRLAKKKQQNPDAMDEDEDDVNSPPILFDIPYRELGFMGVPIKTNVLLLPSLQCLVHLVEGPPWFVLCLEDVEIASFERVSFSLKYFDIVFVLKDFSKNPMHITQIPVEKLEDIQEWLDKNNIRFFVGAQTLQWDKVMSHIREDPVQFYEEGGWTFLEDPEDREDENAEIHEPSEDDFEPEEESSSAVSSEEFDEEDEDEDEPSSEAGGGSDDEEEASWERLEREAKEKDSKRWGGNKPSAQPKKKAKKK